MIGYEINCDADGREVPITGTIQWFNSLFEPAERRIDRLVEKIGNKREEPTDYYKYLIDEFNKRLFEKERELLAEAIGEGRFSEYLENRRKAKDGVQ